jgi:type IV secretion system protein VirB9
MKTLKSTLIAAVLSTSVAHAAVPAINPSDALAQQAEMLQNPAFSQAMQGVGSLGSSGGNGGNAIPVNLLKGVQPSLNAKEQAGTRIADEWIKRPDLPGRGQDGSVVFAYGASLPSVVCAPLYTCVIKLQPGETITQIDLADNVRWKVVPSVVGSGDNETSLVVVKPTDSNLSTNVAVSTDRRLYVIKLISRINDWMPLVSFQYPEDTAAAWQKYNAAKEKSQASNVLSDGQNVAGLDFNFKVRGDSPAWKPERVYTDGAKTYIQFPANLSKSNIELPALLAIGADKKEQLINYRLVNDRFVVDSVIDRAMLVSGIGRKQVRVDIVRGQ